tara:strand:- start:418 stop:558 length:141 start_codon:yes stop_codon:yes gene_type:complete
MLTKAIGPSLSETTFAILKPCYLKDTDLYDIKPTLCKKEFGGEEGQ